MPPKRTIQRHTKRDDFAESSQPRQKPRRAPSRAAGRSRTPDENAHGIIFTKPEHKERYDVLIQRRLLPTRYICADTLNKLGLKDEVYRMFHNIGMLPFMLFEAPTFEGLTLEFLSTVEFKLRHKWNGSEMDYYGDLEFCMFGHKHTLSVEEVGAALKLPSSGPGAPPETFPAAEFWEAITGTAGYNPSRAKATGIHNPCFRYAQKGLAYTLFGRGDSTGVCAKRELFLLHNMIDVGRVNIAAFAANHLKQVGHASTGEISVGGMITQLADHLNYSQLLIEEPSIPGKKIDMTTLVNQRMIVVQPGYYSLICHEQHIMALPAPNCISIANPANWLYVATGTSMGQSPPHAHNFSGDEMEDDTPDPDHPVPPPQQFGQQYAGSSSMTPDQWGWVQTEITALRTEQSRQSVELFRQGTVVDDVQDMMRRLMLHFPQDPPPPPQYQ